jgi:dolichol-phosphate mannosyltransferase
MHNAAATQRWTIGIMCYNEAGSIARVLDRVYQTAATLGPDTEVLAVDDGSADNTADLLEAAKAKQYPNLRIIKHGQNRGIGGALRSIYFESTGDVVVAVPGDGQFNTDELLAYPIVPMRTVFSYYRVENTSYNFFRNGLSWMNKTLNRILLGMELRDVNWILVFRRADLADLDLQMKSSIITSEICSKLRLKGWRFIEIKSRYLPRTAGKSRGASLRIVFKAASELLTLFSVVTRFRWRLRKQSAR